MRNVNVESGGRQRSNFFDGEWPRRCVDIKCKSGSFSMFRCTVVRCSPPQVLNGSQVATINRRPSGNGLRRSISHNPIKLGFDGPDLSNETPPGTTLSQAVAVAGCKHWHGRAVEASGNCSPELNLMVGGLICFAVCRCLCTCLMICNTCSEMTTSS
jgi:hypothetical protein